MYVGAAPWLILCAAFAAFFALLGAVLPVLDRLPGGAFWVGAAWVLQEALRDRLPFGGFPWGRLAFSQAESPVRWFAALGGAPLVTFAVAVGGAGLALCARAAWPLRLRPLLAGAAVLVLVPLLGLLVSWPLNPGPDSSGRTATIAVVQGGLPDLGAAVRKPRRAGARQPRPPDRAARGRGPGRHGAAAGHRRCGPRTRPTSIRSASPTRGARSTGRCARSASRCWSARSCRDPARRTGAMSASCGHPRPGLARGTRSGIPSRSASTSRCVHWPSG